MFTKLLKAAFAEQQSNLEHDTSETKAWNALIAYAIKLEKGTID